MSYQHLCEETLIRHTSEHNGKGVAMRQAGQDHLQREPSESTATPSESSKIGRRPRWADMDSDSDEMDVVVPFPLSLGIVPQDGTTKLRWADLASDDDDEVPERDVQQKQQSICTGQLFARPMFAKPTRDQRIAQLAEPIEEFARLDFDSVSAEDQSGLVLRMLATLKSLAIPDVYWTEAGEKREEERYKLFGLEEEDMFAIGQYIHHADDLIENRSFRKVFDCLCEASPWFAGGSLEELRAKCWAVVKKANNKRGPRTKKRQPAEEPQQAEKGRAEVILATKVESNQIEQAADHRLPKCLDKRVGLHCDGKSKRQLEPWQANAESKNPAPQNNGAFHSSKGRGAADRRNGASVSKLQCQFTVGIEEDNQFGVVRRILGSAGAHMKRIATDTGMKLRLRGRGSKFLEGPKQEESSDPLMLCVSAPTKAAYNAAIVAVESLLTGVHADYHDFCVRRGLARPELSLQLHEGARDGAR